MKTARRSAIARGSGGGGERRGERVKHRVLRITKLYGTVMTST